MKRRSCSGRARALAAHVMFAPPCVFSPVVAPPAGRRSGDVVTAGLILSRVWFGPVPGSP
ncbi:hypothetical protein F511_47499 [Dorcoceras hygrometricum]|uniref:Uncharacterized protein n=1 Tax=Dorcoceras hygrometricum TaxID=472368 RepID=A0A2Z6ZQW8_9LAMI|nr:hypothetical protein F511_47499 [Dorcoceras hygrometricum]